MCRSLITQKALRYEDFTVGEILEGKIDSVSPAGVSVHLGVNLKGFIPKLHWADDPRLKKPELRFRVGEPITCRVLKVMVDRKTIHLTCKKSMLDEKVVAYSCTSQLETNIAVKGTVALIEQGGVLVSFFDGLTGYIPGNRLLKNGITDINRYFYMGQVIDCKVENINESGKVTLTLAKSVSTKPASLPAKPILILGSIVECKVERVYDAVEGSSSGLEVFQFHVDHSTFIIFFLFLQVSIPSLDATGLIPVEHLSDFPKGASQLLDCYRPGEVIKEAVVWMSSKLQTVLTLKPNIVNFIKENGYPKSVDEVAIGSILPCVATCHRSFGVFASLLCPPNKFDVLFPACKMSPNLYSYMENGTKHMTLEGEVIKVDKEEKKIFLSALNAYVPENAAHVLEAFLKVEERIKVHLKESSDEGLKHLASLKLGDVVVGKLLTEFDSSADLEFELPHGINGIVPAYHHAQKDFKKNDLIVGSVMYVDPIMKKVYVTTMDDVIRCITGTAKLDPRGKKQKGKILLNSDYFSLVSITDGSAKDVAFTSNIRSINDTSVPLPPPFEVGAAVHVAIKFDTEIGKIATYYKTPKSWDIRIRSPSKRTSTSSDGSPNKKKLKKDTVSIEAKSNKGKNTQQEQLTDLNDTVDSEKSTVLEVNNKKTKTKAKKNENKKKQESQERDVSHKKESVSNGKRSAPEDKETAHPEGEKSLSPSKKRRVEPPTPRKSKKINHLELPRLSITSTFKWDDDMMTLPLSTSQIADSSDSEDDDAEKEKAVVKDRRERAREKLEEAKVNEAKLSQIEEELNNPERAPVTTDDFDRMVLASPNSSILWVQYMAFHLENAEIEKARTVAQRALKIMSFREEQEKFNVWIAWLNLEHMYGTTEGYESTLQVIIIN